MKFHFSLIQLPHSHRARAHRHVPCVHIKCVIDYSSLFICVYRYTMAGDICIIKVYFDTCDKPILSPVRVIIDEKTARNGS